MNLSHRVTLESYLFMSNKAHAMSNFIQVWLNHSRLRLNCMRVSIKLYLSCTIGPRYLHNIYFQSPQAFGPRALGNILGKSLMPLLQLLHSTYFCLCPCTGMENSIISYTFSMIMCHFSTLNLRNCTHLNPWFR